MLIAIASPIYDQAQPLFVSSLLATVLALRERGHRADWRFAQGMVVHRARNLLVREQLASGADVLVQIDADHTWQPADLICAVEAVGERRAHLVGFPYKSRRPEFVRYTNVFASPSLFRGGSPLQGFKYEGATFVEVDWVGGGILVLSRQMVEKVAAAAPAGPAGEPLVFAFDGIDGEDVHLCRRWREQFGGAVHCVIEAKIGHIGSAMYSGDFREAIGHLPLTLQKERTCV